MAGWTIAISERRFNWLVIGAMAFGFAALVFAGLAAARAVQRNQQHAGWVAHTYEVRDAINDFRILNERSENARRGILLRHDPRMTAVFEATTAGLMRAVDVIGRLTLDNQRQQRAVARLRPLVQRHVAVLRASVAQAEGGQRAVATAAFASDGSLNLLLVTRAIAVSMMDEEARLLTIRDAEQRASAVRFYIILGFTALLLLLVAAASLWVILQYTRDLTRSRAALRALNEDLEGAVRERTVDLQRANEEIQRFAYIVSHDLRSPLVNVMGFTAELENAAKVLGKLIDRAEAEAPAIVDQDARDAAREDLPEAIGFIRTSTQKMDRLINAILRLSREGRRSITPERIDMAALAHGVADSLRHRTDDIGAQVLVEPLLPTIVSDRLGVEQILSNLVENAVKYLKPGRPGIVRIVGHLADGRAIFEVIDNGRGIDPRDHERVFDLFRRSGVQDQPGEGIGLAHVRAMAYRLGGVISVESQLGEGSTFRVNLPATYTGEQGVTS